MSFRAPLQRGCVLAAWSRVEQEVARGACCEAGPRRSEYCRPAEDPKLEGLRLFLLQDLDRAMKPRDSVVVAADSVGCGVGEVVLYASGSSARQTIQADGKPCDATIMAIIDAIDDGEGKRIYEKFKDVGGRAAR